MFKIAEEEISIEEFMELDEKAPERGKVKQEQVLEYITGKALSGSKLATLCGVTYSVLKAREIEVAYSLVVCPSRGESAMYSRLTRLLKKGLVVRRYSPETGKSYWTKAKEE